MPWKISGNCVIRKDTGETIKCHANHKEAVAHLRALYANVKKSAIDKTIMVAKGAPLGNRNAADDYVARGKGWKQFNYDNAMTDVFAFFNKHGISTVYAERAIQFLAHYAGAPSFNPQVSDIKSYRLVSVSKDFPNNGKFVIEVSDGKRYALKLEKKRGGGYGNWKGIELSSKSLVEKGAPVGNRNAAKDYVSTLGEWSDSPLRALEVGQSHYKQIQSAWSDAMDAAYHHDMKKMIQSSAMAENRYKLLQAVVSRSQYKSSRMLMPDVDVPEDVVQAEVQAHNRLYGVLEDAKELVMAIRTAKRRLKSVV